ncbi:MAG: hypothetical protein OXG91_10425 [bacterium]|nr:hypothetical protein [bacterium]
MVAVSWYNVVRNGGDPPGGDMIGHAAAAEWFRTLPWWDWRGWSDWFYGGQAMGVNYPPLGHAWMRFTHPVYGQLAAVTVGLLVLLPWGALRLARAVGYSPREQRLAVGAVFTLAAVSAYMFWFLSGFHYVSTFFGSWPAMMATVLGLFCAAWSSVCQRPVRCGVIAGVALLWNATVMPGVAVLCAALLVSSGASFRQGLRWAATAICSAAAVCAWWLVMFAAGWSRLVNWDVPLAQAWNALGFWPVIVVAALAAATAWTARRCAGPERRLALVSAAVLTAALVADLFGYLRPERWLAPGLLVAAIASASAVVLDRARPGTLSVRPTWALMTVAAIIILAIMTARLELVPLAAWLLWWPRRAWAAFGAVAWGAVIYFTPLWPSAHENLASEGPQSPMEAVIANANSTATGLVYASRSYEVARGQLAFCSEGQRWRAAWETGGRIRPIGGLYRETSSAAAFVDADTWFHVGSFTRHHPERPHWREAWENSGEPLTASPSAAAALGARWYAACTADDGVVVIELPGTMASGVLVHPHGDADRWNRAAVDWWLAIVAEPTVAVDPSARLTTIGTAAEEAAADDSPVPILSTGEMGAYPADQPASGVTLHSDGDALTVRARQGGWAWLRVPWDPWWHSEGGTPVRKGGPGHLVVWAPQGETTLRWAVPQSVDVASATVTGVAALAAAGLAVLNRRRGFHVDPHRPKPAAQAVEVFADTVDQWMHTAARRVRRAVRALAAPLRR